VRDIQTYKQNVCNEHIRVEVLDEPGVGGACHHYGLSGFSTRENPSATPGYDDETMYHLIFQNGPIAEAGVNGITNESLLAIVLDRLNGFQQSEYKCRENALAITKIEEAMHWMLHRTRSRESRGVEGTHEI
jgi:hypothetical protein